MWRSSWWLRSCGTPTPSRSSSPSRLLRPAQTIHLKSTKGCTWLLRCVELYFRIIYIRYVTLGT
ncbi:hypothetical protein Taro_055920 [Colocasia esculenta]|uniref:Uncharacterized protein n=1 Tax=Colocasia esculenta TaxID=4460 RepID=A0A843XUY7_COLES|nr:hypothetical protein [Colocasia esculenta]